MLYDFKKKIKYPDYKFKSKSTSLLKLNEINYNNEKNQQNKEEDKNKYNHSNKRDYNQNISFLNFNGFLYNSNNNLRRFYDLGISNKKVNEKIEKMGQNILNLNEENKMQNEEIQLQKKEIQLHKENISKLEQELTDLKESFDYLKCECQDMKESLGNIQCRDLAKNFLRVFGTLLTDDDWSYIRKNKKNVYNKCLHYSKKDEIFDLLNFDKKGGGDKKGVNISSDFNNTNKKKNYN